MKLNGNISEKQVENLILQYLNAQGIFAWKNQTVGIYDSSKKVYRKPKNKFHINGVADILGILPNGKFLAIEVKSPKNKVRTLMQKEFIDAINRNGGVAFFADDLDLVRQKLFEEGIFELKNKKKIQKDF